MRVSITRIDTSLPLPKYATEGATGFDLFCREDVTIAPASLGSLPSNVIVTVPDGYVLIVALRSGTPRKTGLISPHGVGVIDRDYCGPHDEIKILVFNPTPEEVIVHRGDRVAQGLLMPVTAVEWEEGPPVRTESRGGFGSTG